MQMIRASILASALLAMAACQTTQQSESAGTPKPRFSGRTADQWVTDAHDGDGADDTTLRALVTLAPHDARAEHCVRTLLADLDPQMRANVMQHFEEAPDACRVFEAELVAGLSDPAWYVAEASAGALLAAYRHTDQLPPALASAIDGTPGTVNPAIASALNACAWSDVAPQNARVASRERAVRLAEAAVRMTDRQTAAYLDTLAWALYWADRRPEAVKVEKEALAKMQPNDQNRAKYEAALARFEAP